MKAKKYNLNPRFLTIVLSLSFMTMQGCMSGSGGGGTTAGGGEEENAAEPTFGVAEAVIGDGFDTATGRVINLAALRGIDGGYSAETRLVFRDGKSTASNPKVQLAVNSGAPEAENSASYSIIAEDHVTDSSSSTKNSVGGVFRSLSAGVGQSYQAKEATQSTSNDRVRTAGAVIKKDYYLTIDQPNSGATGKVPSNYLYAREALLNENPDLARIIYRIDNAKNDAEKKALVYQFYTNFGREFVSRVTRGSVAYVKITATERKDTSASNSLQQYAGELSAPLGIVKISSDTSISAGSSLSKANFNFKMEQKAAPASFLSTATDLLGDIDSQLTSMSITDPASAKADLSKLNLSSVTFPTLAPDKNTVDQIAAAEAAARQLPSDISLIESQMAGIKEKVQIRDTATDKGPITTELKVLIGSSSTFKTALDKFTPTGVYGKLKLSVTDQKVVSDANLLYNSLITNIDMTAADLAKAIADKELLAKNEADKKAAVDAKLKDPQNRRSFTEWAIESGLKDNYASMQSRIADAGIKASCPDNLFTNGLATENIKACMAKLSAADIYILANAWNVWAAREGLLDLEGNKQRLTGENMRDAFKIRPEVWEASKVAYKERMALKANYNESYITLNYSTTPWQKVFPELNVSYIQDDGVYTILNNMIGKVSRYNAEKAYLAKTMLMTRNSNIAGQISSMVPTGEENVNNNMAAISEALRGYLLTGDKVQVAGLGGRAYDFSNESDVIAFDNLISLTIKKSALYKEGSTLNKWHNIYSKLKDLNLISSRGVLASRKNYWGWIRLIDFSEGYIPKRIEEP